MNILADVFVVKLVKLSYSIIQLRKDLAIY